ncbi:uncharacterized protein N7479_000239 [Penicillium vulpinum]|uniref:Uncharacterized protein n=1 Tax=Penicillium vulpinum TaxID=29845 RepID=A0A1V6RND2_9EURO|nr:uncharacterized protein N7479_000239 [Penicillium vulpinum]KAJ5970321.1 hypothetical protein N7479_000239 [Penicillium vulpinum]OQE03120.1 hypothetical protein PENVUL_c035G02046 [Penicillium vulpinum]
MASVIPYQSNKIQGPDPTISLKQALLQFEGTLTDDQKQQYQARSVRPDAASVIAFVGEIDSNKSTTRRCVAPRLHSFLQATQQFSAIVDTFVSSNPEIAALVWGGIKTAILIASNITSYFDKVTSMIMAIGRSCPTYQQFGHLYPGCAGLQRGLCDYYATIVQLCIKIIEISKRTAVTQVLSSIFNPFEAEFKRFLDQLDEAVKDIQLQLSFASKKANADSQDLLKRESHSNSAFRRYTSSFYKDSRSEYAKAQELRMDILKRQAAELRSSVRDNLSSIDYDKPWKQASRQRVPSTAEWLQQEQSFLHWKDGWDTEILWCSGTMGVGKTVLMSNAVVQLHASLGPRDILSYYFCSADYAASLSARNIFGCLARQLLNAQIEIADNDSLRRLYKDSRDLNAAETIDFLLTNLKGDNKYYIILDGLDECEGSEIQQIAQGIAKLCSTRAKGFKLLCAGRPGLEKQLFRVTQPNYAISVTEQKVESDMEQYIATTLACCLDEGQLKLGDPNLIIRISNALHDGSKGMFLWTRLLIEELCAQGSDHDILAVLNHLPRGLSEIFDRKLHRLRSGTAVKDAIATLQFCGVLKRSLTVMEYQEALSLSPGQTTLDSQKFPNDMDKVIRNCCGLIFVDEEDSTVHYVHHSVKQHLFNTYHSSSEEFDTKKLDQHLGLLCMTYLDFNTFKRQISKVAEGSNTPITPVQLGITPIYRSRNDTGRIAMKLLLYRRNLQHLSARELERKSRELLDDLESSGLDKDLHRNFQFLNYARSYWIYHVADLDPDHQTWKLFSRCVDGDIILAHRPWESTHQTDGERNDMSRAVQWLLAEGHFTLFVYHTKHQSNLLTEQTKREIIQNSRIQDRGRFIDLIIQQSNNSLETLHHALYYASREGFLASVKALLQTELDVNARVYNRTALQVAAEAGHLEVVERLLNANADVNAAAAAGYEGRTALQAAAGAGHLAVVERLLQADADVHAAATKNEGRTALQAAAGGGHLAVVERLLQADADVNTAAAGYKGRTALQAAAGGGHLAVVERLLQADADVNATAAAGYEGRTALQAAAAEGHLAVIERLLQANADVNAAAAAADEGRTALQAAAGAGHLAVVERLLQADADVNTAAAGYRGRNALQAAAGGGHLAVVERLLQADADVNAAAAAGYEGRTALQAAAGGGHLAVVERLLQADADVNATAADEDEGRTALQAAAGGGHLAVVERLLQANANVNAAAAKFEGRTALQAAAGGGHLVVVERLLQANANVNAAAAAGYRGQTALQAAAGAGYLEVADRLRQAGAHD